MTKEIYLDYAATTPVADEVVEMMLPWMGDQPNNANSTHQFGRQANVAVEQSREFIASVVGAEPSEIIFTSGGTEANNAAIHGSSIATAKKHFVSSIIEHHAVLHPIEKSSHFGYSHTLLTPNSLGTVSPDQVNEAIQADTALVSLMHVNNELGAINPISEIAEVCKQKKVLLHSDCVQSIGKHPINLKDLGIDFASMSAHKIYGPKGVGFLYVRRGAEWTPWLTGGSQERNRRGGTLNVAGIVGMAKALDLCQQRMESDVKKYSDFRAYLLAKLKPVFGDQMLVNGGETQGMPHILNLSFVGPQKQALDGEMLLFNLDIEGIAVSNGSACTSGAVQGSHVLRGIGHSNEVAKSSIRISFGRPTQQEDLDYLATSLINCVHRMMDTTPA